MEMWVTSQLLPAPIRHGKISREDTFLTIYWLFEFNLYPFWLKFWGTSKCQNMLLVLPDKFCSDWTSGVICPSRVFEFFYQIYVLIFERKFFLPVIGIINTILGAKFTWVGGEIFLEVYMSSRKWCERSRSVVDFWELTITNCFDSLDNPSVRSSNNYLVSNHKGFPACIFFFGNILIHPHLF